jgi:MFS family permease
MGYNAITSKYSVYASAVLQLDYNKTLLLAQAAALIAFVPVGMLATKIGRKKSILIGVACLTSAVFIGSFFEAGVNIWLVNVVFIIYDIALTKLITFYFIKLRHRFKFLR